MWTFLKRLFGGIPAYARLVWRYRRLHIGRVTDSAAAAMLAAETIELLRRQHPGRRFFWSFPTNSIIDSSNWYVCVWEVVSVPAPDERLSEGPFDNTRVKFWCNGPLNLIRRRVLAGELEVSLPPGRWTAGDRLRYVDDQPPPPPE